MIIGLDTFKTVKAFADLSGLSAEEVKYKFESSSFFQDFEKGNISENEFRKNIRSLLNSLMEDSEIDQAWNAMLLEFSSEKLNLLKQLKSEYKTFLLSNTNAIHLKEVNKILYKTSGEKNLDFYFHQSYYSHLMGMRKPNTEIFNHVVIENKLNPSETIFLDDHAPNISGAAAVGIQTKLITQSDTLLSLFS